MKNNKVIVFGATGGTGKEAVIQLLAKNYIVTAILRNPQAFEINHSNLRLIKGDVLSLSSFENALSNQDAVISALGSGKSTKATTVYSVGTANIIRAMQKNNVNRLLCISAGGLNVNSKMSLFVRLLTKYVLQRILKEPYSDMRLMETEVKASTLEYTIVRPSRLTDNPAKEKYRYSVNEPLSKPWSISRTDLAHFMVNHLETKNTFKTIIEISD